MGFIQQGPIRATSLSKLLKSLLILMSYNFQKLSVRKKNIERFEFKNLFEWSHLSTMYLKAPVQFVIFCVFKLLLTQKKLYANNIFS